MKIINQNGKKSISKKVSITTLYPKINRSLKNNLFFLNPIDMFILEIEFFKKARFILEKIS